MTKTRMQEIKDSLSKLQNTVDSIVEKIGRIENNEINVENRLNEINDSISHIKDTLINNLIEDNNKLRTKVTSLENRIEKSEASFYTLENYNRRNNLEIDGIPNNVSDINLENTVINVFNSIGVNVDNNDVEACHRIGKKSSKTIVRLVNRKNCKEILSKKAKLKDSDKTQLGFPEDTKIFISENVCNAFNHIGYHCRRLKRAKKIHHYYTKDGKLFIGRTQGEKHKRIEHLNDLRLLYPNFDFDENSD